MKAHFVIVTENSGEYLNMAKLLLHSFRKNAGSYKDAPFTVVFNGDAPKQKDLLAIQKRFAPLYVHVMPRLGGHSFANKFNAYYAVDSADYDILVYLDCDTLVLGPLDDVFLGNIAGKPFLKARWVGRPGSDFIGYESLIRKYGKLTESELCFWRNEKFFIGYPLFNSGVQILTREAVCAIRDDAVRICYDLYTGQTPKSLNRLIQFCLREFALRLSKKCHLGKRIERSIKILLSEGGTCYPLWNCEQMALALAVIKNRIPYEILDEKFNSKGLMQDGSFPVVLHYFRGLYRFDRSNMFEGGWVEAYLNSGSPIKRVLAQMASSYIRECHDDKLENIGCKGKF